MKSHLNWLGGKSHLLDKILPFPKHRVYCDMFGGGGSLLLGKTPCSKEIYNDVNSRLVNHWKVLRKSWREMKRLAETDIDSRELFFEYQDVHEDKIEDAYRFFYVNRHSFSSIGLTYQGITFTDSCKNTYRNTFLKNLDRIEKIHDRIKLVKFENQDFDTLFKRFYKRSDTEDTLFYLDPPYYHRGNEYERTTTGVEWTQDSYEKILSWMLKFKNAKFVLSIDNVELFEDNGWDIQEIERHNWAGTANGSVSKAIEYVVRNFDPETTEIMKTEEFNACEF